MLSARIRRSRERLACLECRKRKLRCDRTEPCSSCVRRGDGPSCSYVAATSSLDHERDLRIQAEERLAHLEQLVHQLAAQQRQSDVAQRDGSLASVSAGTDSDTVDARQAIPAPPPVQGSLEDAAYIGESHWSAMLDDIDALRSAVSSGDGGEPDSERTPLDRTPSAASPMSLLFGTQASAKVSVRDILEAYLPSRHEADGLVSSYFWRTSVAAPFIHSQQFRRQYQAFWASPTTTPVLWISILFSILHISQITMSSGPEYSKSSSQYSTAAALCLALGEYFRPRRFAVEALLIYVQSYCLTSLEISMEVGAAFSVLVRLATSMGYHRDPGPLDISPFEKEMRRRTWSLCMQLDLLTSFHLGLPSSVQYPTWNTSPPSALLDSEFDEDTVTLPTPMPRTELTGLPFYVAKHHLMVVFEKILRHVLTVRSDMVEIDEVVALEGEIRRVYASLPKVLRRKPMSECVLDPPSIIVTRLCVSLLHNKCLCVLHRLYVTKGRLESIPECYAAASAILHDFLDAEKECRPGGVLEGEQWFMTSITWHDFLLGATSLCMVVCAASSQRSGSSCIDISATLALLERAQLVCAERARGKSRDTVKVRAVITATIRQFGTEQAGMASGSPYEWDWSQLVAGEALSQGEIGPPWIDMTTGRFDDPNWSFLDHFLDLPAQSP